MITPFKSLLSASLLVLWVLLPNPGNAQKPLESYIETGLKNNLVLQQKNINIEKAVYSLKIANSLFMPGIAFKADYQSGEGGRQIAIPVGDMLNPVYSTLNQLTSSNAFPQIGNMKTNFLPYNFYDLKVRTSVPLVNTDLIYNRSIQQQQVTLQEYDAEIYRQELVRSIKQAYYNYLSAVKSVSIYDSALELAREGKRINESLLRNGKTVKAYVLRVDAEIQSLEAGRTSALLQCENARIYFNFLLNAEPSQPIDTTGAGKIDVSLIESYLLNEVSASRRTELKSLQRAIGISESVLKMNRAFWTPRVNGFLDLGSQASDWKFNSEARYYFMGIQLEVPLFASGKNYYKVKQAGLDLQNYRLQNTYVSRQLQMSVEISRNALRSAYQNYQASSRQFEAASSYKQLIDKAYLEGAAGFIETIDARNQYTTASLQVTINTYQLLIAVANFERESNK